MKEMIKGKRYEITKQNIMGHEIIGLMVKVIESTDSGRVGTQGIVVDETKKTLLVTTATKDKVVFPKIECTFEFDLDGEKVIVKGNDILKRAEDRVKEWRN